MRSLFRLSSRTLLTPSAESISLSKQDKLFKDAIETAATSGSTEVAEELLTYFVYVSLRQRSTVESSRSQF